MHCTELLLRYIRTSDISTERECSQTTRLWNIENPIFLENLDVLHNETRPEKDGQVPGPIIYLYLTQKVKNWTELRNLNRKANK